MSDLVRTAEWWEQTFGGTETNYVTAERDGETWYFRRFTQNPAAARITELETALAEAEGRVIAEVVAWLRDENGQCDCFARSEGECACGAWDDYKTKPLLDIATALETGEWKK